jgi:hypothetical protein
MPVFFEDVYNDGFQGGVNFKKAPTLAGNTALTAGGAVAANLGSASTNPGIYFGSGAPTASAPQGSLYVRSDGSSTSTRLYVATNSAGTWTNVTSAA